MPIILDSDGLPILDSVSGTLQDAPPRGIGAVEVALGSLTTGLLPAGVLGALTGPPVWGVFDDSGVSVIDADSVLKFGFRKERHVADYPIEEGQFASYNKVALPMDARMVFVQAESDDQRSALLDTLDTLCDDLNLYIVLTPEASYENINLIGYEYDRSAQEGIKLLRVDVRCREIRTVSPATASEPDQTQDSSGADVHDEGAVQTIKQSANSSVGKKVVGQKVDFNTRPPSSLQTTALV